MTFLDPKTHSGRMLRASLCFPKSWCEACFGFSLAYRSQNLLTSMWALCGHLIKPTVTATAESRHRELSEQGRVFEARGPLRVPGSQVGWSTWPTHCCLTPSSLKVDFFMDAVMQLVGPYIPLNPFRVPAALPACPDPQSRHHNSILWLW